MLETTPGRFWEGARVLITGAAGFTGSWLCRELQAAGAEVIAFVKKESDPGNLLDLKDRVTVFHGDILDFDSVVRAMDGVDYAFNSAAVVPLENAANTPQLTAQVNSLGAYNVAYAALLKKVHRLVQVSTPHVYGNKPEAELPMTETTPPTPLGVYAVSKYAGDLLVKAVHDEGLEVVWTRSFSKYGPGQSTSFLVAKAVTHLLQGKALTLGNPKPMRDYTYVTDVVRGYMLAAQKGEPGGVYHFCWGAERTAEDVVRSIRQILDREGVTEPVAVGWTGLTRPHEVMRQVGGCAWTRKQLDWAPLVPFDEGLVQTVRWFREQARLSPPVPCRFEGRLQDPG